MNCEQAQSALWDYLDNKLTSSDESGLLAHLRECQRCEQQFHDIIATQHLIRDYFRSRVAAQFPNPQIWSDLEMRIASPPHHFLPSLSSQVMNLFSKKGVNLSHRARSVAVKGKFSVAFLTAAIVVVTLILFVSNGWAKVGNLLKWFTFDNPGGGGEVSIPGAIEFSPLRPSYLPPGFKSMVVGLNPEVASLNYWNESTRQILIIDQNLIVGKKTPLPEGKRVTVNGYPAVLIEGLKGEITFTLLSPTPEATSLPNEPSQEQLLEPLIGNEGGEIVSYTDGRQLIWDMNGVRFQITSNLPLEEILKVAESLIPAEAKDVTTDTLP